VDGDEAELCYSARLVEMFARALSAEGKVPRETYALIAAIDPDERIPFAGVHQFLRTLEAIAPDPYLGLRASRQMILGDTGALDYAMSSAATLRDCLNIAARYVRLINDAGSISFTVEGELAVVRLSSQVKLPRAAIDFRLGNILWIHGQLWPEGVLASLTVSFPYAQPDDLREYRLTFGDATLCFSAAESGFTFPACFLAAPLRSTDPKLHSVIRRHAEVVLANLPSMRSVADRVRALLVDELAHGEPSADTVARRLFMSKRTLGRRLEDEGTTFSLQLDALRKDLSLKYLLSDDLSIADVALLTGFSSCGAFHRAFRRWTGDTPRSFRVAARQLSAEQGSQVVPNPQAAARRLAH
jgi:AraC-like DNA-binding protein